tara:strand:- start:2947 stop:3399 length:453 start_codon:yes stop_codon:yes gene_type:complete
MFDKKTEKALSVLDTDDLFKVSKMIQKLAKKKTPLKTEQKTKQKTEENIDSGFLHKIEPKAEDGRGEPISTEDKRANLFDKMPEKNHHKEDVEIDKKLAVQPPSDRSRKPVLIDVQCRACNKEEKISASLVPQEIERYICNRCQVRGMKK